jgi:hypothetical protein
LSLKDEGKNRKRGRGKEKVSTKRKKEWLREIMKRGTTKRESK